MRLCRTWRTPLINGKFAGPFMNPDRGEAEPFLNHAPKTFCEATMSEEMRRRLLSLLAKLAKATIIPPSLLKAVRRPNPILSS
jgi:hypothetical protein